MQPVVASLRIVCINFFPTFSVRFLYQIKLQILQPHPPKSCFTPLVQGKAFKTSSFTHLCHIIQKCTLTVVAYILSFIHFYVHQPLYLQSAQGSNETSLVRLWSLFVGGRYPSLSSPEKHQGRRVSKEEALSMKLISLHAVKLHFNTDFSSLFLSHNKTK